jgi:hypothetical protein
LEEGVPPFPPPPFAYPPPRGEIAQRALQAAWDLATERALQPAPGGTVRCLEQRLVLAGVGRQAARGAVKNLVRAGHLVPVGRVQLVGCARPLTALAPAGLAGAAERRAGAAERRAGVGADLLAVAGGWVGQR